MKRIGLDIGGTKTEAVVIDDAHRLEASVLLPTEPGPEAVLRTAETAIRQLAERTGIPLTGFASVGIGIPGQVDRASGEVRNAVNIAVTSLPLGSELAERTGIPVHVDNDVTAAALGTAHLTGVDGTLAYLNLGTGLAAGIVIDGHPWRGRSGVAGEIGHLPFSALGRDCPCGQRGCLETVASGSALRRGWTAGGDHPGRHLLAAIDRGDAEARLAFDRLVEGAAQCVRILALSVDPDCVVIGGGLRLLGEPLIEGIRGTLEEWARSSPFLTGLSLDERVQLLARRSPAAAVGAALTPER